MSQTSLSFLILLITLISIPSPFSSVTISSLESDSYEPMTFLSKYIDTHIFMFNTRFFITISVVNLGITLKYTLHNENISTQFTGKTKNILFDYNDSKYFAGLVNPSTFLIRQVMTQSHDIMATSVELHQTGVVFYTQSTSTIDVFFKSWNGIDHMYYPMNSPSWNDGIKMQVSFDKWSVVQSSDDSFIFFWMKYNTGGLLLIYRNNLEIARVSPSLIADTNLDDFLDSVRLNGDRFLICYYWVTGLDTVYCFTFNYSNLSIVKEAQVLSANNGQEYFWLRKLNDNEAIVASLSYISGAAKFHVRIINSDLDLSEDETVYTGAFRINFINITEVKFMFITNEPEGNYYKHNTSVSYWPRVRTLTYKLGETKQFHDIYTNDAIPIGVNMKITFQEVIEDWNGWTILCNSILITDADMKTKSCAFASINYTIEQSRQYTVFFKFDNTVFVNKVIFIGCAEGCSDCTGYQPTECTDCVDGYFLKNNECDWNENMFVIDPERMFSVSYTENSIWIDLSDEFDTIISENQSVVFEAKDPQTSPLHGKWWNIDDDTQLNEMTGYFYSKFFYEKDNIYDSGIGYLDTFVFYVYSGGIRYSNQMIIFISVCSQGCSCSKSSPCDSCLPDNYYYFNDINEEICYDEFTKLEKWYYDGDKNKYLDCFNSCKSCTNGGSVSNHNCKECADDLHFVEGKGLNCFDYPPSENYELNIVTNTFILCPEFWYLMDNNSKSGKCVSECPEYLHYIFNSQCVENCSDWGLWQYINTCVNSCPNDTIEINFKCFDISKDENDGDETVKQVIQIDISDKDLIDEYINHPPSKTVKDWYENNILIVNANSTVEYIKSTKNNEVFETLGLSSIFLGSCETILRKVHNIENDDHLIIAKIDIFSDDEITPQVEYKVYDKEGNQLNLELCEGIQIEISLPLHPSAIPGLNLTFAQSMTERGFDILDPSSPFYNDICIPYSDDVVDVNLKDRRGDIFIEIPFCEEDCVYKGVNFTTVTVMCSCDIKLTANNDKKDKKAKNDFINSLSTINIWIFKCVNLIMDTGNMKDNLGVYIFFSIFGVQLLMGIFLFHSFKYGWYVSLFKYSNKCISDNIGLNRKGRSRVRVLKKNHTKQKKDKWVNELSYTHAIKSGYSSSFLKIISTGFINGLEVYTKIINPGEFDLITINVSIILLNVSIDFTWNAWFFSDDVVSERYENQGSLNFTTSLILSSISLAIGWIVGKIWSYFSLYSSFLELFVREIKTEKQFLSFSNQMLIKLKRRFMWFYCFLTVIMSFSSYYCYVFCVIYSKSQKSWIYDCWIGNMLSISIVFGLAILMGLFRYLGWVFRVKRLYIIALYLEGKI